MNLDNKDIQLLDKLQDNGRITNAELAKHVCLSPSSTLERVKKLESSGLIDKYITLLNPQLAGYRCFTYVEVKLARHGETPIKDFKKAVANITEILECHHITGEADFLLKIATKDIPTYEELILHQLSALPNVKNFKTSVVLSTFKQETRLVI